MLPNNILVFYKVLSQGGAKAFVHFPIPIPKVIAEGGLQKTYSQTSSRCTTKSQEAVVTSYSKEKFNQI